MILPLECKLRIYVFFDDISWFKKIVRMAGIEYPIISDYFHYFFGDEFQWIYQTGEVWIFLDNGIVFGINVSIYEISI